MLSESGDYVLPDPSSDPCPMCRLEVIDVNRVLVVFQLPDYIDPEDVYFQLDQRDPDGELVDRFISYHANANPNGSLQFEADLDLSLNADVRLYIVNRAQVLGGKKGVVLLALDFFHTI